MSAAQDQRYEILKRAIAGDLDCVDALFGAGGPAWLNATALAAAAPVDSRLDTAEGDIDTAQGDITTIGGRLFERTLTVGHADLTAAALTQAINVGAVLPVGTRWLAFAVRVPTPFAGGTVATLTCQIGWSGSVAAVMTAAGILTGTPDIGTGWSVVNSGTPALASDATAGKQLIATFTSTVDNLVNLTAGSIEIKVLCIAP